MNTKLEKCHKEAIELLRMAYRSMSELAAIRHENKLSNMRIGGVVRELGELLKVMSVYEMSANYQQNY